MSTFNTLQSRDIIQKTMDALKRRGIDSLFAENGSEARKKVLDLIPGKSEVFDMTSETLRVFRIAQEIQESGKYDAVRPKLLAMDPKIQQSEMQKLGSAPQWAVGSVQAVTQDGEIMIASNTGSQLSAYVYGASHVLWVVGAQKIVKDIPDGFKRIYEYVLPLESARAKKAYGVPGSNVSKLLIVSKEIQPGRITVILVNEIAGF